MRYTRAQLSQAWQNAGGDPALTDLAASVAIAEQGSDPQVANWDVDGYSYGPWQIHYVHIGNLVRNGVITKASDLLDLYINAQAAVFVSGNGQDWSPWSTCNLTKGCTAGSARGIYNNYIATSGGTQNDLSPGEQVMNSAESELGSLAKGGLNLITGGAFGALENAGAEVSNIETNLGALAVGIGLFVIGAFLIVFTFGEDIANALGKIADKVGPIAGGAAAAVVAE